MLTLAHVSKSFRGPNGPVASLSDLSLTVEAGQLLTIAGPSGSGKTTLLLCAGVMQAPDQGQVTIAGEDPYALPPDRRAAFRAARVGFVFQQHHLVPYLNVLENVMTPALAKPHDAAARRAAELLERFGLTTRAHHRPAALSAGERQRVVLARALFHRPPLILADEPTGSLDPANARIVLDDLRSLAREGCAVVMVTHDPLAAAAGDLRVRLELGRLAPAAAPAKST